jgi:SAM-dependent methyltransferase
MVARAAARELVARLSKAGISSGTVVDLAAGSGILSRSMVDAGFAAWGVDISDEMLRIARSETHDATFVHGSLWKVDLPPCVAVAAVGEAFSYAMDPSASLSALDGRFGAIHRALSPGGLLLFDVASPGRSGPSGTRSVFWSHEGAYLGLREHEDGPRGRLSREITQFLREGGLYRRVEETHELQLYAAEEIEDALARSGFRWERLSRYDQFDLAPGWNAYAATKAS